MQIVGLVERAEELRTLEGLYSADQRGIGRVALIEGAAGTGKTTLLHTFAGRAVESGAVFLCASASSAERGLPLSAVSQFFQGPALRATELERAAHLLNDGALTALAHGLDPDADDGLQVPVPAPILGGLSEILLDVAERGPLVIGVDDIHHADVASLRFLLYLARRTRSADVLLVLTECMRAARSHPLLHADLLRLPGARRLRLQTLSRQGVTSVLAEDFDQPTARRLAAECHLVSGGNPLLVHALAEDLRIAGAPAHVGLVYGDAFRQAVLTCLYRSESTALARGMAVLAGGAAGVPSAALLGDLVHLDAESVGRMRAVLGAAGLLDAERFRHDAVQTAVLGGMRPDERTAMHLRAAELLHNHGARATAVADHLRIADRARTPWAVTALQDGALQAVTDGDVTKAISYLRLARHESDNDQRPIAHLALARTEWQIDPATAGRHLPELTRYLREGRLPAGSATTLIGWQLWLGRTDEALETMIELSRARASGRSAGDIASWPDSPRHWLRFAYPGLIPPTTLADALPPSGHASGATAGEPASPTTSMSGKLTEMLASALAGGRQDETIVRAEQILHESDLTLKTPRPIAALAILVYTDESDKAARWVDLLGRSAAQSPPLGNALFTALRALMHVRRGELAAAYKGAQEALDIVPPRGWGVAIGVPMASMLLSSVAMGKHEVAEKHLDTPVPEAMFQTPCILPYLQARGRLYLATNRPQAALAEFQTCGELMTRWGFDVPGFVPWRTDMAQAHLAMGNCEDAKSLAEEQLARIAPEQLRTRGLTLRTLALTLDIEPRVETLSEAVELLEKSGDRLDLAYALADLSDAYRVAGREHRAGAMGQRARLLGAECGVTDIGTQQSPRIVEAKGQGENQERVSLTSLSEAERRVATLAANGYTNRQIAIRLHVTMSTVEQHLTRVYRKLNISRRTDLPLTLLLLSPDRLSPVRPKIEPGNTWCRP
jgi:DNA-binding CsgD family transcriptional regulator